MHLLVRMNDSRAGKGSRQLAGALKHMIVVRANLADNCVGQVPSRQASEKETEAEPPHPAMAIAHLVWWIRGWRLLFDSREGK